MYICNLCQKQTTFTEQNVVETELIFDKRGALASASDAFVVCETIICGQCGASSEDGHILHRSTKEPVQGGGAHNGKST